MIDLRIKALVDKVLNDVGVILGNGNGKDVSYYCPFCKHRKRKFEINLNPEDSAFGSYGCWVCRYRNNSTGTNLISLFRKIGANTEYIQELKSLLSTGRINNYNKIFNDFEKHTEVQYSLPKEFLPLWIPRNTPEFRNAIYYVKKRGCTDLDIIRYGLGYCEDGEYKGKIIIPSYDAEGNLNFFTGRDFYGSEFGKHKNPKWSKNIIGFELFINWRLPIILVEGGFDAITVKRNVIPLFGKTISEKLKKKIIQERVTDIYIALDADAIRDLIPLTELFMSYGINTYIVRLPDGTDPNKLGYIKFMQLINNTKKATLKELVQYKLKF